MKYDSTKLLEAADAPSSRAKISAKSVETALQDAFGEDETGSKYITPVINALKKIGLLEGISVDNFLVPIYKQSLVDLLFEKRGKYKRRKANKNKAKTATSTPSDPTPPAAENSTGTNSDAAKGEKIISPSDITKAVLDAKVPAKNGKGSPLANSFVRTILKVFQDQGFKLPSKSDKVSPSENIGADGVAEKGAQTAEPGFYSAKTLSKKKSVGELRAAIQTALEKDKNISREKRIIIATSILSSLFKDKEIGNVFVESAVHHPPTPTRLSSLLFERMEFDFLETDKLLTEYGIDSETIKFKSIFDAIKKADYKQKKVDSRTVNRVAIAIANFLKSKEFDVVDIPNSDQEVPASAEAAADAAPIAGDTASMPTATDAGGAGEDEEELSARIDLLKKQSISKWSAYAKKDPNAFATLINKAVGDKILAMESYDRWEKLAGIKETKRR